MRKTILVPLLLIALSSSANCFIIKPVILDWDVTQGRFVVVNPTSNGGVQNKAIHSQTQKSISPHSILINRRKNIKNFRKTYAPPTKSPRTINQELNYNSHGNNLNNFGSISSHRQYQNQFRPSLLNNYIKPGTENTNFKSGQNDHNYIKNARPKQISLTVPAPPTSFTDGVRTFFTNPMGTVTTVAESLATGLDNFLFGSTSQQNSTQTTTTIAPTTTTSTTTPSTPTTTSSTTTTTTATTATTTPTTTPSTTPTTTTPSTTTPTTTTPTTNTPTTTTPTTTTPTTTTLTTTPTTTTPTTTTPATTTPTTTTPATTTPITTTPATTTPTTTTPTTTTSTTTTPTTTTQATTTSATTMPTTTPTTATTTISTTTSATTTPATTTSTAPTTTPIASSTASPVVSLIRRPTSYPINSGVDKSNFLLSGYCKTFAEIRLGDECLLGVPVMASCHTSTHSCPSGYGVRTLKTALEVQLMHAIFGTENFDYPRTSGLFAGADIGPFVFEWPDGETIDVDSTRDDRWFPGKVGKFDKRCLVWATETKLENISTRERVSVICSRVRKSI